MQNHMPKLSGIGLRAPHVRELLDLKANIGFLEAHSENYFGGGQSRKILKQISEMYPVTLHGVGLSLGRADGLDQEHIRQIKSLVNEINPVFVSEHLTWSGYSHIHVPDLLPIPFINEALDVFAAHVNEFQDKIGRQVLVENPSNYLAFANLDYTETEFLNLLVERTGCGLLLDINNIAVSGHNLGYDPVTYIEGIVADGRVKQFHLAGYQVNDLENGDKVYLDTHGKPVYPEVWDLYVHALRRFGDVPTLIEWDTDIPALDVLVLEAAKADDVRARIKGERHDCAA
ncbi:MAG: hypothetical protein AUJ12_06060 [Alphaproteobacteria bacterium CG1_02_46_17]|nr:MAG: hypothetical protein AUJ12_06060 [Alphaproteobacteria bacterium CG1_02_46_17]